MKKKNLERLNSLTEEFDKMTKEDFIQQFKDIGIDLEKIINETEELSEEDCNYYSDKSKEVALKIMNDKLNSLNCDSEDNMAKWDVDEYGWFCTNCHEYLKENEDRFIYRYCPYCGSKMVGGKL